MEASAAKYHKRESFALVRCVACSPGRRFGPSDTPRYRSSRASPAPTGLRKSMGEILCSPASVDPGGSEFIREEAGECAAFVSTKIPPCRMNSVPPVLHELEMLPTWEVRLARDTDASVCQAHRVIVLRGRARLPQDLRSLWGRFYVRLQASIPVGANSFAKRPVNAQPLYRPKYRLPE